MICLCVCFDRFTEYHKCLLYRFQVTLLLHGLNHAFAKIPVGGHTLCACFATSFVAVCVSVSFRSIIETIILFEAVFVAILG